MIPIFWGGGILARCPDLYRLAACAAVFVAVPCASAQTLEKLARAYSDHPTVHNRVVLERYAAGHKRDAHGALAFLALASQDVLEKRSAQALTRLHAAAPHLRTIEDYTAFLAASAEFDLGEYAAVVTSTGTVFAHTPKSPLTGRAALLAANAWLRASEPRKGLDVLKAHYLDLAQPDGDMALAVAFEAVGDPISAAAYYQRVYYGRPLSGPASDAGAALDRLKAGLGNAYPAPAPQTMLARAGSLLGGGAYPQAQRELEALAPMLAGPERDAALVEIGQAEYGQHKDGDALQYFESLNVTSPEADAERLYYVAASARRLKNMDTVRSALADLAQRHPRSKWRLEAIVSAANHYLLENDVLSYTPLYQECYQSFPDSRWAPYCHWKVAFAGYLNRQPAARDELQLYVRKYPGSEKASAALYFLGRLAEIDSQRAVAHAYYNEIIRNYPNYYYAVLARNRLHDRAIVRSKADAAVIDCLSEIKFPVRARRVEFEPDAAARQRIARARLLSSAALDQYADLELQFAADSGNQPHLMGFELAQLASRRGSPDQAIRYIKRYAPGYLHLPLDSAPNAFWRLAFPLPYRQSIAVHARRNGLDPYLVAALIRQESEFNAHAVSHANAYGLTQVLPSTGRMLSRQLGMRRFTPGLLFRPDFNIRVGTYYMKSLVTDLDGNVPAALAAYNAGKNRAIAWLSWGDFSEPAEFVEAVPFSETRNYIQIVMRNADLYRRIYATTGSETQRRTRSR